VNEIVIIEEFKRYKHVTFYTIRYDDSELSETDKFIKRFLEEETVYKDDLDDILNWINEIGIRGLKYINLRAENDAYALPPYTESSNLRLFCIKITNSIILLGNGGIKSSQTVQESNDLSMKFHDINRFSKSINEAIRSGNLIVDKMTLKGDFELFL